MCVWVETGEHMTESFSWSVILYLPVKATLRYFILVAFIFLMVLSRFFLT